MGLRKITRDGEAVRMSELRKGDTFVMDGGQPWIATSDPSFGDDGEWIWGVDAQSAANATEFGNWTDRT